MSEFLTLILRLEHVLRGINQLTEINLSLEHRDYSEISRVLLPGQLMRFASDSGVDGFIKSVGLLDDDYDIITHTDPLGFDVVWYSDGKMNPKNYLCRNQLPNLHIDMTNVYNPEFDMGVNLKQTGVSPSWFMPMIHSSYQAGDEPYHTVSPQLTNDVGWGYYINADVISRGGLGKNPIDLTTYQGRCARAVRVGDSYQSFGTNISRWERVYIYSYVSANVVKTSLTAVFPSPLPSVASIPQSSDRSNPSLGFFWFNDGNYPNSPFGQIELPKDPECKIFPIIKIRRTVFV